MQARTEISASERKALEKLLLKKYRQEEGRFLIEGPHLVQEALASTWTVCEIIVTEEFHGNPHAAPILRAASRKKIPVRDAPAAFMRKLSETVTPQGVIAVVEQRAEKLPPGGIDNLCVALDAVADPGNVGTIIRTADWFGAGAVFLGKGCVEVSSPKVLRASMGSLFHLPVYTGADLRDLALRWREHGGEVIVTVAEGGERSDRARFQKRSLFVFGNEAAGITVPLEGIPVRRVTIPKTGNAESLNVAISCGILLSTARS